MNNRVGRLPRPLYLRRISLGLGVPLHRKYAAYIKSVLVILVGVIVSLYSVSYLTEWVKRNQETANVPVPAYRIPAGQVIQAGDLTVKKILKAALEPGIAADVSEVAGRVPAVDLLPGEPVLKAKLLPADEAVRDGEALVTVKIERLEAALGGNVKPNMLVNVLYVADKDRPPVILAENARVVSVLAEDGRPVDAPGGTVQAALQGAAGGGQRQLKYVTLKVKRSESYEFVRPLTGGYVLLAQVGYAASSDVKPKTLKSELQAPNSETPQPQASKPEAPSSSTPQPQTPKPETSSNPSNTVSTVSPANGGR